MLRPRRRAAVLPLIIVTAVALYSQEASTAAWRVSQPYPSNPLRQATIAGTLASAATSRLAELQIECRAPQLARINLRFPANDLKFNLDPFEGPEGVGQKRKLLTIERNRGAPAPHTFSGFYVESNVFVFSIAPPRTETRSLVSSDATDQQLQIQVSPADGEGDPLVFHFTLPSNNAPAFDVAKPCNNSKAKNRESDPQ